MKLKPNEKIATIATTDVKTVTKQDKLSTVWELMSEFGFHHVPVVEGTKLIGAISHTDLMRINFSTSFGEQTDEREMYAWLDSTTSIAEVMQTNVVTIKESETIRDAVNHFKTGKFHGLPVLDKSGSLVAMVTSTDIMKWIAGEI
ncbi:MAG: CBS domain-containing protein [Pseudobacteriovorax sp.]|nr:CBS domain-containing protein [Pseudobacteriovorax sp.]